MRHNSLRSVLPMVSNPMPVKYQKKKIPKALREQAWVHHMGPTFDAKCPTTWCSNRINVFNFHTGHKIPECKGGPTTLENLIPLCDRCNLSMSHQYTFEEWCQAVLEKPPKKSFSRYFRCFTKS
jgi:5-methylcytosine-specific restriction endonuclease McrA